MSILRTITNLIYRTEKAEKKFLAEHLEERVLIADASKGIMTSESDEIKKGFNWVTSQRAVLILSDKRIKCGQWDIPLEQIESAVLVKIKSLLGSSGQVLKITTKNKNNFQFGMQTNSAWEEQIILPLSFEEGKIKKSAFSIIIRIVVVIYFVYWLIQRFS